jgi:hypothetical protein
MDKIVKTPTILDKTINDLLDGLTGIALSDKTNYVLTASKLLKGLRSGKFLSILNQEWKEMQKKGKISSDFEFDEIYYDSLSEILDYLDNDIPNHNIFNVLKNIFIKSAIEEQKDDLLPLQFIKIAKELTEGELIVLSTIYRLFKTPSLRQEKERLESASNYISLVAHESGLKHNALVEIHEQKLIEKKLITGRHYGDGSGVRLEPDFRLTSLGKSFCDYVENYKENEM